MKNNSAGVVRFSRERGEREKVPGNSGIIEVNRTGGVRVETVDEGQTYDSLA